MAGNISAYISVRMAGLLLRGATGRVAFHMFA